MTPPAKTPSPARKGIWLVMVGVATLLLWFFTRPPAGQPAPVGTVPPLPAPGVPDAATVAAVLPGDKTLLGYGDPTQPPEQDLTLLHHCLDNFLLLAKGMKTQPLSANGEIAAALRGEGKVRMPFISPGNAIFNAEGLLIDRWGTPLFFHAEQAGAISIRSAGPDKTLWTADDLHRQPGGSFLRGEALNPPSLN